MSSCRWKSTSLLLHALRAHLQMLLWKSADKDKPPAAASDITNFDWESTQDCAVMPSISDQQVAPAQLLDIVSSGCSAEKACNQMNCSCRVAGLSCTDYCTCAGGDHCCKSNDHST